MAVMIDWVTARVPLACEGFINGGRLISIDALGEVAWETDRRLVVEGSHSSSVTVRGGLGVLEFSGNPSKFLQGHNLFGSAALVPLMDATLQQVAGKLGLTPSAQDLSDWRRGHYEVSRIDITRMIDCGSPERVRKVLEVLGHVARTKYQKASIPGSGTVYLGQKSRRVTLKFYDKWAELQQRGHNLCATLAPEWHRNLLDFAAGKLRVELTIRSNELGDRHVRQAKWWTPDFAESALDARLAVLEVSDTMRLAEDTIAGLPPKLVPIYDAWRAGRDLRALYSKAHFYRLRSQLLPYGIDIAKPQPREIVAEDQYIGGFPIASLLRSPGVTPPDWAKGTLLLACSTAA